ncbi:MAG: helix-turn-helix domain-containing protein, partial [Pseudonocardiaceae bacterium]
MGPQWEVGMGEQVSAVLRGFRRRAALAQEALAERSGVSVSTIRRLETGARGNPQPGSVVGVVDDGGFEPVRVGSVVLVQVIDSRQIGWDRVGDPA